MNVVITQPMLFPWVGMFEQIRLADICVYYDDVQFSKGSFTNRVQIKTIDGFKWLTIPLHEVKHGKNIIDYETGKSIDWRSQHIAFLKQTYKQAPFLDEMLGIVTNVYDYPTESLSEILIYAMDEVTKYLGFFEEKSFYRSSKLAIEGASSQRVLDIVKHFQGTNYITGHGAKKYLNHELFEANNIEVSYMEYQKKNYQQLYGDFNPYVSILDLIANKGNQSSAYIVSGTESWKKAIK